MIQDRFSMPRLDVVGVNLTTTVVRPSQDFYAHLQSVFAEVSGRHPPRSTAWVKRRWERLTGDTNGSLGAMNYWISASILQMLPLAYRRRFPEFAPQTFAAAQQVIDKIEPLWETFNPDHYEISAATREMLDQLCEQSAFRFVAITYGSVENAALILEAWPEFERWFESVYVLGADEDEVVAAPNIIVPCSYTQKRRGRVEESEIDRMLKHLGVTGRRFLHMGSHWYTDALFGHQVGAHRLLLDHELCYLGSRGGWRRRGRELLQDEAVSPIASGRLIVVNNHADATSIILNTAKAGTKRK